MTATARTQYIDNVKKGIEIYTALEALKNHESLWIDLNGKVYEIMNTIFDHRKEKTNSYSIGNGKLFGSNMNINIEKSNKTSLFCYTYDLFSNESHQKIYFEDMKITSKPENFK
jgi:hypothetical protein